jgi:hypothetical protein
VIPALGGSHSSSTNSVDWGLPFFYGRRVANAIEGVTTAVGTGPHVAFSRAGLRATTSIVHGQADVCCEELRVEIEAIGDVKRATDFFWC